MTGQPATELVTRTEGRVCASVAALLGVVGSGLLGCGRRETRPIGSSGVTLQGEAVMGDMPCPAPPRQFTIAKVNSPQTPLAPMTEKTDQK